MSAFRRTCGESTLSNDTRYLQGKKLLYTYQDRNSMYDAHMRSSRCGLTQVSVSVLVRLDSLASSGHEYRPDCSGKSLLGRLGCDACEASRGGP